MAKRDGGRYEPDRGATLDGGEEQERSQELAGTRPIQAAGREEIVQASVEHDLRIGGRAEPVREAKPSGEPAPEFLPTLLFVLAVLILAGALVLLLGSGVLG